MDRLPPWVVVVLCLSIVVGLVFVSVSRVVRPASDPSNMSLAWLTCPTPVIELGEVWAADDVVIGFDLRNYNPRHAFSARPRGTCSCVRLDPPTVEIPADGVAHVTAHLDLVTSPCALSRRQFEEEIIVPYSSGGGMGGELRVVVTGTAVPAFRVEPCEATLPSTPVGGASSREVRITWLVEPVPTDLEITSTPDLLSAEAQRVADGEFVIPVTLQAGQTPGIVSGDVVFRARDAAGVIAVGSFPARARVRPEVEALPGVLAFGHLRVGEDASASLSLVSVSELGYDVESVVASDQQVWASEAPGRSATQREYTVHVLPREQGPLESNLEFRIRRADGLDSRIGVVVRAYVVGG